MSLSLRYAVERATAVATAVAGLVTAIWPAWIEAVAGVDPDHGNGMAEWVACGILAAAAVAFGLAARADHRRLAVGAST